MLARDPRAPLASLDDEVASPSRDGRGALSDPVRVAAEPPITRPSRLPRQAFGRAGSPILVALLAAALCATAVFAVPRRHQGVARAEAGIARIVSARVARALHGTKAE